MIIFHKVNEVFAFSSLLDGIAHDFLNGYRVGLLDGIREVAMWALLFQDALAALVKCQ